jgi:hypothetical protein
MAPVAGVLPGGLSHGHQLHRASGRQQRKVSQFGVANSARVFRTASAGSVCDAGNHACD